VRSLTDSNRFDLVRGDGGNHPREGQLRRADRDVRERPVLQIEDGRVLVGVGDLEDEATIVRGGDEEVAIPLAGQLAQGAGKTEALPRQGFRAREVNNRAVKAHRG